MNKLGARRIKGFLRYTKPPAFNGSDRQRQIVLRDLPQYVRSLNTAKHCAWCDSAAVIATETDDVAIQLVKPGQVVRRHSNHAEPAGFKLDAPKSWKKLAQRSLGPGPVNRLPHSLKRTNTAKHESPGAIEAK
ncbi:hypothetical protein ABIC10_001009 [Bradyrhizobium sp. S3.2.12]